MVTQNGDNQPQTGDPAPVPQDGGSNPQPSSDPASTPSSGADNAPVIRTYTEEEFKAAQATSDSRLAESQQATAKAALSLHTERALAAENAAKTADSNRVVDGEITQDQADARTRDRNVTAENAEKWRLEEEQHEGIRATSSVLLKAMSADAIGKMYDVDPKILIDDPELVSETLMTIKALKIQNETLVAGNAAPKEPEEFDGGGGFSSGGAVVTEGMSPTEMAVHAYGDAETAKRKKNRG